MECLILEKSYCISAYVVAGKFSTRTLNPRLDAYIFVIHRQTVSLYQNTSVWQDRRNSSSKESKPG